MINVLFTVPVELVCDNPDCGYHYLTSVPIQHMNDIEFIIRHCHESDEFGWGLRNGKLFHSFYCAEEFAQWEESPAFTPLNHKYPSLFDCKHCGERLDKNAVVHKSTNAYVHKECSYVYNLQYKMNLKMLNIDTTHEE